MVVVLLDCLRLIVSSLIVSRYCLLLLLPQPSTNHSTLLIMDYDPSLYEQGAADVDGPMQQLITILQRHFSTQLDVPKGYVRCHILILLFVPHTFCNICAFIYILGMPPRAVHR